MESHDVLDIVAQLPGNVRFINAIFLNFDDVRTKG